MPNQTIPKRPDPVQFIFLKPFLERIDTLGSVCSFNKIQDQADLSFRAGICPGSVFSVDYRLSL